MECNICKKETEVNDFFECDGCTLIFHPKCDGINKKDVNARKGSDRLKLFCLSCTNAPESVQSENIKTALKFIHKIDLSTQLHEKSQTQACYDIERIKDKLDLVVKNVSECKNNEKKTNDKLSYANVIKSAMKLPVVVKPKEKKQNSEVTREDITKNISFKDVKASGLKKIRDGGIVINCQSHAETVKISQIVQNKVGDKYSVVIPELRKPRLKLMNVYDEMSNEEIVENIKAQNELLNNAEVIIKAVINKSKNKNIKYKLFDVIIEVNQETYDILKMMQYINLGWSKCRVVEHFYVKRCYNCCGFNHIAKDCTNKKACGKCGGEHDKDKCKSRGTKCINCYTMCEKYKLKLNTNHEAFDKNCEMYKRKIKILQDKISFKSNNE